MCDGRMFMDYRNNYARDHEYVEKYKLQNHDMRKFYNTYCYKNCHMERNKYYNKNQTNVHTFPLRILSHDQFMEERIKYNNMQQKFSKY